MKLGKKAIIGIGIPLGLGLAAGLAYVFLISDIMTPKAVPEPSEGQHGVMVALEDKVVNLLSGGDYRYAKVGVTVEIRPEAPDFYALKGEPRAVAEKEAVKVYEAAIPLLVDAVGRTVGAKTSAELGTPAGRDALKAELLTATREILGKDEHEQQLVLNVYFTDLVMQ